MIFQRKWAEMVVLIIAADSFITNISQAFVERSNFAMIRMLTVFARSRSVAICSISSCRNTQSE